MKVEIVDTAVQVMAGTAKRSGKPYEMHLQTAYLHNGRPHPDRFEVILPKSTVEGVPPKPYQPGMYEIDFGASLDVFGGRLSFNPVLKSAQAVKS